MDKNQMMTAMLKKQIKLNEMVSGEDWHAKSFRWHTSLWIECAEVMETIDWKWWKHTGFNGTQFLSEMIDVWHFGLSMMLLPFPDSEEMLGALSESIVNDYDCSKSLHMIYSNDAQFNSLLHRQIERLALSALTGRFNSRAFFDLMNVAGMSMQDLYCHYLAKQALNQFRALNGYKDGTYKWSSKQDNERLQNWLAGTNLVELPEHLEGIILTALGLLYREEHGI